MVTKDKTGFINVDTAFYDNSYESPDLYYYTIPGLPLSGKLAGDNAATLTFGANGTANFKCAALSVDANGTYVTYMNMDHQEIIFTFGDNVIRGSYEFNIMTLTFSFTVISATGDYAPYIPADSVFSYTIPAE